ncbi:MAG: 4-hydroxy-tetrahydrodipicolinate synthase [Clostridia bacterium]|nr:4-hydroxy-tetrahydrodipicolinate synthase [Clostridia bacterium]
MREIFSGVGVALATPFRNGKIDFNSMEKLINKSIKEGASAIVILATTGEASTITEKERTKVIRFCRGIVGTGTKLIVGTGCNDFSRCKKQTTEAKSLGADACLVVTPYYNKTTQTGIIKYYEQLSHCEIPLIMYNVPARTGLSIEVETVEKIIQTNPFVFGLKESTCDINRIIKLHKICKNKVAIYSGEDELNFLFYCLGANGSISVTANALCKKTVSLFESVKKENLRAALSLQEELSPINNALFCETNPVPIKHMLKEMDLIESDEVRLPLVELSDENKKKIKSIVDSLSSFNS